MKVLLFGRLGDLMGREARLQPGIRCATVGELRAALAQEFPTAAADLLSNRVRAFVNHTMAGNDFPIGADDEVSLMPPVSGG